MKIIYIVVTLLLFSSYSYADKNMKIGHKGKSEDVSRVIKVKM